MQLFSVVSRTRAWPFFHRLMLAVGLTLVAFIIRNVVLSSSATVIPFLTYYPAVLLSTVLGGHSAGAMAAVLSAVLAHLGTEGLFADGGISGVAEFLASAAIMIGIIHLAVRSDHERTIRRLSEERENRLRQLIDQAPVSIAMFDRDMIYLAASKRWFENFGLKSAIGQCHYDLFPTLPERWRDAHRRGMAGESLSEEFDSFADHEGTSHHSRWQLQPWRTERGDVGGIIIISEDLTAGMMAERALQGSEERLRLALDAGQMAVWDWDIASGRIVWNDQYFRLLGYEPGSIEPSYDAWAGRVLPEDLTKVEAKLREAMELGIRYSAQYRVRGANDQIHWIQAYGQVSRLEDGRPERFYGMILDVTDRVYSEAERQKKLEEIEALYDNAPLGLVLFDKDFRYLRINRTLAQINGAPVDAHFHRTLRDMVPIIAPVVESRVGEVFSSGRVIESETTTQMPGSRGEIRTWKELIYPIKDADGRVDKVGMFVEDITARKTAESHARLLLSEVNHRAKNLLAVVQAVAEASADEGNAQTFVTDFKSRIAGLAACHELLVHSEWHGVDLGELIRSQLRFLDRSNGSRICVEGPPVHVNALAAQCLGMSVHELATNAVKYGALLSPQGQITVHWSVDLQTARFRLRWTETGGPSPRVPARVGFGTSVLMSDVKHALDADVTVSFLPAGLDYGLSAPLEVIEEVGRDSEVSGAPAHY
jgi:PAS domain S-box-containing protein